MDDRRFSKRCRGMVAVWYCQNELHGSLSCIYYRETVFIRSPIKQSNLCRCKNNNYEFSFLCYCMQGLKQSLLCTIFLQTELWAALQVFIHFLYFQTPIHIISFLFDKELNKRIRTFFFFYIFLKTPRCGCFLKIMRLPREIVNILNIQLN